MKWIVIAWMLVATGVAVAWRPATLGAGPEPIVQVGEVYLVIESCEALPGKCFGELHVVKQILDNQWIATQQCANETCTQMGSTWRLNLARVYAIRRFVVGHTAD